MATVTIDADKIALSELLARVEAGNQFILTRGETPVARLTPYRPITAKRRFGALRGVVSVGDEFFDPLPDDESAGRE